MGIIFRNCINYFWLGRKTGEVDPCRTTGFYTYCIMAVWILLNNLIYVPEITDNNIPKQLKVLAYFKGVAAFMGITVISILLKSFKLRFQKASVYILLFFALVLFFMVFNIQQMLN